MHPAAFWSIPGTEQHLAHRLQSFGGHAFTVGWGGGLVGRGGPWLSPPTLVGAQCGSLMADGRETCRQWVFGVYTESLGGALCSEGLCSPSKNPCLLGLQH